MSTHLPIPEEHPKQTDWRKSRRLARDGFKDLAYLPTDGTVWNATLAAIAFAYRRQLSNDRVDLNRWAAMHGAAPSARYASLARPAALWHGTSGRRAEKIRDHGLFHRRGVWSALDPRIAHSFTRGRSRIGHSGSAMVVIVVDQNEIDEGSDYSYDNENIVRFHRSIPPEWIAYILLDDHIDQIGERAAEPKPWGRAHFHRRGGKWLPKSHPPVRFDAERSYRTLDEWLELSVRCVLTTWPSATAVEIFAALYQTLDPWQALEHSAIFSALDRLCLPPRRRQAGLRLFALKDDA